MATPTVVLLPVWGVGHLMSMLDAGKRLLARSGGALSLTVLVMQAPTEGYRSEVAGHIQREEASGLDIRFQHLPAVEPPTDHVGVEEFISRFVQLHAAHVKAAISGLTCPVAALVVDFFGTTMLDVSCELAVPAYVYFTASAAMYALFLRLPALQEEVAVEFEEMEGMVDVPGLPPVPPSSLPSPLMDKKHPNYAWFVYHGRRFMEAKGVIINTAAELETSVVAAIADGRCTRGVPAPTVYPVGPVLSLNPPAEQPHECVLWLDTQPPASVVLLCFGSGGFSGAGIGGAGEEGEGEGHGDEERTEELEEKRRRYLEELEELEELLPEGFLERTKGKGMVWPTRAPQKEILAHAAVGGFLTHGGWNSTLEALWFGVPMVPWPRYAEQHLNAFTLVAYMGVALYMEVDRKRRNWVEASELERAVKALMDGDSDEGKKVREKAMAMKSACRKAVVEGGSSYSALGRLSEEMINGANE